MCFKQGTAHLYQKHNAASHHSMNSTPCNTIPLTLCCILHFGCIMRTMAAILRSQWSTVLSDWGPSQPTIGSMLADHVALQSTLTTQCATTFSTGRVIIGLKQQCSNLLSHVTIDRAALQSIKNVKNLFFNKQTISTTKCAQVCGSLDPSGNRSPNKYKCKM